MTTTIESVPGGAGAIALMITILTIKTAPGGVGAAVEMIPRLATGAFVETTVPTSSTERVVA